MYRVRVGLLEAPSNENYSLLSWAHFPLCLYIIEWRQHQTTKLEKSNYILIFSSIDNYVDLFKIIKQQVYSLLNV